MALQPKLNEKEAEILKLQQICWAKDIELDEARN